MSSSTGTERAPTAISMDDYAQRAKSARNKKLLDGYKLLDLCGLTHPLDLCTANINNRSPPFDSVDYGHLSEFTNLRLFQANGNNLTLSDFCTLPALEELTLSCNHIKHIHLASEDVLYDEESKNGNEDTKLLGFSRLYGLDLSFNFLSASDLEELSRLPMLRDLNLESNRIDLTKLTDIDLSGFRCLRRLSLRNNKISTKALVLSFEKLGSIPTLEFLDLSSNHIRHIPPLKGRGFRYLRSLQLSDNRIEDSRGLLNLNLLPKIEAIGLEGNPICVQLSNTYSEAHQMILENLVNTKNISLVLNSSRPAGRKADVSVIQPTVPATLKTDRSPLALTAGSSNDQHASTIGAGETGYGWADSSQTRSRSAEGHDTFYPQTTESGYSRGKSGQQSLPLPYNDDIPNDYIPFCLLYPQQSDLEDRFSRPSTKLSRHSDASKHHSTASQHPSNRAPHTLNRAYKELRHFIGHQATLRDPHHDSALESLMEMTTQQKIQKMQQSMKVGPPRKDLKHIGKTSQYSKVREAYQRMHEVLDNLDAFTEKQNNKNMVTWNKKIAAAASPRKHSGKGKSVSRKEKLANELAEIRPLWDREQGKR